MKGKEREDKSKTQKEREHGDTDQERSEGLSFDEKLKPFVR